MNRLAAYCYGISAVSVGCIIQNSSIQAFWDSRPYTSALLGAAVPLNVGIAWLLEHKPFKVRAILYTVICFTGIFIGLLGIGMFIFSISRAMGLGFVFGVAACYSIIQLFVGPYPEEPNNDKPKRTNQK